MIFQNYLSLSLFMGFLAAVLLVVLVKSFFLISVVDAETITNQSNAKIIRLGSSLSPNNTTTPYWLSPSGIFAFGFYPQGGIDNAFSIRIWMLTLPENVIVWTANIDGSPLLPSTATLELTRHGLLLRTRDDLQRRIVSTFDEEDGVPACAAMFDSGNFVLFGNESNVIWDSFDSPTDTILGGQNLRRGHELVSTGLGYRLSWRNDGTLVLYAPNSFSRPENAYWDSGIPHKEKLFLNNTGVLYIYSRIGNFSQRREFSKLSILANGTASGYNPSKSRDTTIVYRATLDADGIFRLYSHHILSNKSSSAFTRWSNLQNQCDVKGFCGLNSYCARERGNAVCVCYPGFVFIDASTRSQGCYQNFSEESCRPSKEERLGLRYNISTLKNLWWEDHPFSVTPMLDKELCKNSCLEDCNCWATLYSSPNCSKYRLPLRYGKVSPNKTTTAFFKVVSGKTNDTKQDISSPPENQPEIIDDKNHLVVVLALCLSSAACMLFIFAASSFIYYKRRVYRYKRLFENANIGLAQDFSLQSYSYEELERATDGFREELGRGSFGAVYKGTTSFGDNEKTIAVKRLEKVVEEGIREFQAEMTTIGRTHHRNVVQLLGFCVEGSKRLLVYEFMSKGSLADFLFKAKFRPAWKERARFALDVAKGLFYLHEECGVHIIHCNLKPQNILLDDTLTAKISDFGFARLLLPKQAKALTSSEESTRSYFAPEWQKNALITVKSDIYSFGIVLLEIICCRRNIDLKVPSPDEVALSNWVCDCFMAGELNKLVELDEDVNMRTLERMVKVGMWCIQDDPDLRPLMKNVILMLEGTVHIPIPPPPNRPFARS